MFYRGSCSDSGKTMGISCKRLILRTPGSDVLWGWRLPEHAQYFEGQGGFIFRSGYCRHAAGPLKGNAIVRYGTVCVIKLLSSDTPTLSTNKLKCCLSSFRK